MSKFFKVAIVGAGNVAWHLARALEDAGHCVTDIYSRRITNARKLATRLYDTKVTSSLNLKTSEADIFIVAVPDDSIEEVAASLKIPPYAIVVHTSGTQSIKALSSYHDNSGIFYPLQTFTKGVTADLKEVPICIEAVHQQSEEILHLLGNSISNEVHTVFSEDRKAIHVAAIFACNFSNHMFSIAQEILERNDIDFRLLHPLIAETVNKALAVGADESQTGPARRGDRKTVQKHLKFLRSESDYRKIYKLLSEQIKEKYS